MGAIDIAVIGGGIHGVAVAQAAAAAGYSVKVLEQYDKLANGTSSRSSKLIHGGLRYLESLSFGLVRECLTERAILLENASGLVKLQPFHIPIYKTTGRSRAEILAGLALYRVLGGGPFSVVPRKEWHLLDGLNTDGLIAVYRYYDAQTDDAKLTRAVMDSALSLGAKLELGAQVTNICLVQDGCEIAYEQAGQAKLCSARIAINAAGPWSQKLLGLVEPKQTIPEIDLVQGTHLILPEKLNQGCYYVEAVKDHRPVFFLPWGEETLIGTTETVFSGDPGNPQPLSREIDYLLETRAFYFPDYTEPQRDSLRAFAGLRVLPKSSKEPNTRKRETILLTDRESAPRILSILGGKLTAHRATAEKTIQKIASSLPARDKRADTRELRLTD